MTRAAKPLLVALCAALCGCSDGGPKGVDYTSMDKTLGRWPKIQQGTKASSSELPPQSPAERLDAATDEPAENAADDDAGAEPRSNETPNTGDTGNGSVKTPTTSKPDSVKAGPPRLTFSVLTEVQHMRVGKADPSFDDDARGPKNMGAIWVSKPDGTFVRSLQVWRLHKMRYIHLVAYNKACNCPEPDVIATATLNKHKEHVANWDMTDRDGKAVPEGPYTLHIEVADYDVMNEDRKDREAKNAVWSIDFDTKTAPKKLMPEAAEFFTNLKLELFAP